MLGSKLNHPGSASSLFRLRHRVCRFCRAANDDGSDEQPISLAMSCRRV